MHLENISLTHFKNYEKCRLDFSSHINCLTGPNGGGKTNLLDAIHYLSITRSAFNPVDQQNINHGKDFMVIKGDFHREGKSHQIRCVLKRGEKKVFEKNRKSYGKLSEHVGLFPVVLLAPQDTDLIREGSSDRRRFLDSMIAQIDPQYLSALVRFNHLLKQRNQLLKQFALKQTFDAALIAAYDQPMLQSGGEIFGKRNQFIEQFRPLFEQHFGKISEGKEAATITYRSHLFSEEFESAFLKNHQKDLLAQRTLLGIHTDDLVFELEGRAIRKFGSQGQQKSFVIALKLAQFETIYHQKGFKPILLLDDIFDKLDDYRIRKLMEMVAGHVFGQLFITDARPERTARILQDISGEKRTFLVELGTIIEQGA